MKPFVTLGQVRSPDGSQLTIHEHDGEFFMKHNGRQLMSTTATSSELLLSDLGCEHLAAHKCPRVLIGGLGLGYTLRRVLELVSPSAVVHVAELLPEVVDWNRRFLGSVNGLLLNDRRVQILIQDVFEVIRDAGESKYDSILLDVDHTPASLVQSRNSRIYERRGFELLARSLKPHGRVAFWSATEEPSFVRRLSDAGFEVKTFEAKAHERAKRAAHRIYVAERTIVAPTSKSAALEPQPFRRPIPPNGTTPPPRTRPRR